MYIFVPGQFSTQLWQGKHWQEWGPKQEAHEKPVSWGGSSSHGVQVDVLWPALLCDLEYLEIQVLSVWIIHGCRPDRYTEVNFHVLEVCLKVTHSWREVTVYAWRCSLSIICNNRNWNSLNIHQKIMFMKVMLYWEKKCYTSIKMAVIWKAIWQCFKNFERSSSPTHLFHFWEFIPG